METSISPGG
jgi:hypothetical protein